MPGWKSDEPAWDDCVDHARNVCVNLFTSTSGLKRRFSLGQMLSCPAASPQLLRGAYQVRCCAMHDQVHDESRYRINRPKLCRRVWLSLEQRTRRLSPPG